MSQVIAKIDNANYRTILSNGRHEIIADEPTSLKGTNLGPTPYEFLLMSLGSCIAITLRMYADRKGWDLQEAEVHLSQNRVRAKDCEDCKTNEGYIHVIEKKVKLIGDLDEKQRKRLMEVADKCPVNKTLLNEIKITTEELVG